MHCIYMGPWNRPPNAGTLEAHKCHLVFLLPCLPLAFLLEPCQIGEAQKCHLVFLARLGRFCPLGIEVEKQGFRTAWLITGQKFP